MNVRFGRAPVRCLQRGLVTLELQNSQQVLFTKYQITVKLIFCQFLFHYKNIKLITQNVFIFHNNVEEFR